MSLKHTAKSALLYSIIGLSTGCSVLHEGFPAAFPAYTIPRTSLTTSEGERKSLNLNDLGDSVKQKKHLMNNHIHFVLSNAYESICKELGLDPSVEPKIAPATRINVRNDKQGIDIDAISDQAGQIDLGSLVLKIEGRNIGDVRNEIKEYFGKDTQINLDVREGDIPANLGQLYFLDLVSGRSGQEPLYKRKLLPLATKFGLFKDSEFIFIYRENNGVPFVLVHPTEKLFAAGNIPLAHNDLLFTGTPKTDLQEFEAILGKFAGMIGSAASGSTSARTIDQNIEYFRAPNTLQNPQYHPKPLGQ